MTVPMTATSIFQSTPPARGATFNRLKTENPTEISIHAPREGGDHTAIRSHKIQDISIHAPREGGDAIACMMVLVISIFQSTPPARGATFENEYGQTYE